MSKLFSKIDKFYRISDNYLFAVNPFNYNEIELFILRSLYKVGREKEVTVELIMWCLGRAPDAKKGRSDAGLPLRTYFIL